MTAFPLADLLRARAGTGNRYHEFLSEGSMSVGLYVLAAGAVDGQSPHTEDEVYVVLAGASRFTAADETVDVRAGDTIFVAAGVEHRFHDIIAELQLIVVFAPPERSGPAG